MNIKPADDNLFFVYVFLVDRSRGGECECDYIYIFMIAMTILYNGFFKIT